MAGLIHIFDGEPLPDGKYHVTSGLEDIGIYIRVIDGKHHEISKEEFENDVPTVDPPY